MALRNIAFGASPANSSDINQYYQLLTGSSTQADQPVTLPNSLTVNGGTLAASSNLTVGGSATFSGGITSSTLTPSGPLSVTGKITGSSNGQFGNAVAVGFATSSGLLGPGTVNVSSGYYINGILSGTSVFKMLAHAVASSNQNITSSGSSAPVNITNMLANAAPDGVHDVRIIVSMPNLVVSSGTQPAVVVQLQSDGVPINSAVFTANSGANQGFGINMETYVTAPTSSTHAYQAVGWLNTAASGFSTINSSATFVTQNTITVEQVG